MFASQAGIPCVDTTDGATKLPGLSDSEQIGIIKYHLAQCVGVAENHRVILNVEAHGPVHHNPETLLEIVRHFDSPYVGVNFDTGNSFIAGRDPVKFLNRKGAVYVNHALQAMSARSLRRRGVARRASPPRPSRSGKASTPRTSSAAFNF